MKELTENCLENKKALNPENTFQFARQIGLDFERFKNDIRQRALADKVEKLSKQGLELE